MKQINLKSAEISEIIIRPNEVLPVTVMYNVKDESGVLVFSRTITLKKNQLSNKVENLAEKILEHILTKEEL